MNRSKPERLRRPAKTEFATTGIVIGLFAGTMLGFVAELTWSGGKLVMAAGAFAGICVGSLVEAMRFGWRRLRFRAARKS